ncbi:MAG: LacI family transcriptional regulator [Solirubrobacteraceae bacterium]|jgi:DNA-binding LacI/PurR family transcriptional regulator|nr:LacI family transcriptional regulator [Solirubrobacteraceae bacterium]
MEPLPEEEIRVSTIARVAARAGVGVGTVSRVLNDSDAVRPATRRRVQAAIDALGYEPSAAARALSTGRTMAIGVIAPFVTRASVVERLRGVAPGVSDGGYQLVLLDVERPEQRDDVLRSVAVKGRFDGLLVISLPLSERVVARMRAAGVPIVLVDRRQPGLTGVHIDDEAGGRLATRHLLGLGHKRIAFLGDGEENPYGFDSSARRRAGYEAALRDAGVEVDPDLVVTGPHGRDTARALTRGLLALPAPPTAIFAASDDQALGVLEAASSAAVPVPGRLSVVGFDDIEIARHAGLTTVAQPLETSGALAVDLLLDALAGGAPPQSRELPCELVVRATTAGLDRPGFSGMIHARTTRGGVS